MSPVKLHPRLSAEGVLLARRGERLRREAERDARGWVIGYGHRASAREGARVDEDGARALLIYDLSRTADTVAPLLPPNVPQPLFDALNAYAWRVGPEVFAGSDLLRRLGDGEVPTPSEVTATRDRAAESSAVLAAAAAVRDRVSQVLDAPSEPPPTRQAREPWREPLPASDEAREAPTSEQPDLAVEEAPSVTAAPEEGAPGFPEGRPVAAPPEGDPAASIRAEGAVREPSGRTEQAPHAFPPSPALAENEPPPPPRLDEALGEPGYDALPWDTPLLPRHRAAPSADDPLVSGDPAPLVSFERGGQVRLWERWRGDPRLYMAVGACGLALFLCALAGSVLARPTASGVAVGLVGVLCLAPAIAFFLHRRAPPA